MVISKGQVKQIRKKGEANLSCMAKRRRRLGQNKMWSKHRLYRGATFKAAAEAILSSYLKVGRIAGVVSKK